MKVLFAPDKFAGTLTAAAAARSLRDGWATVRPDDDFRMVPMADGGEGSLGAIRTARPEARISSATVADPLGRPTTARWLTMPGGSVFIEAAEACGLHLLSDTERDPLRTTTRGVGELILAASRDAAGPLVVGLGGSATVDGGAGALQALGLEVLDSTGSPVPDGGAALAAVASVAVGDARLVADVIVATDVTSVLDQAAPLFGPQKGADEASVLRLSANLDHFADVMERDLPGGPWRHHRGSGASGGLGFGLMAALHARVEPGAAAVATLVVLDEAIEWADIVVTGEGSLDEQSLAGKAPVFVAEMAERMGRPVLAVAGRARGEVRHRFDRVVELGDRGLVEPEASVHEAGQTLASMIDGSVGRGNGLGIVSG